VGLDERDLPLPAAYERERSQGPRYFERSPPSAARGFVRGSRPAGCSFRATRAPFLSATFAPVLLGLAVAARAGFFDPATALITVVAASVVHFGLNVANDVFDTMQGADDANATPTKFSGGSRVLQNGLISMRGMSLLALSCYLLAGALGLALFAMRGSAALVVISAVGLFISLAYTMPPFKLVYRGLGEIATAIGFGPVMLLGAYASRPRGLLSWEAFLASGSRWRCFRPTADVERDPERPAIGSGPGRLPSAGGAVTTGWSNAQRRLGRDILPVRGQESWRGCCVHAPATCRRGIRSAGPGGPAGTAARTNRDGLRPDRHSPTVPPGRGPAGGKSAGSIRAGLRPAGSRQLVSFEPSRPRASRSAPRSVHVLAIRATEAAPTGTRRQECLPG